MASLCVRGLMGFAVACSCSLLLAGQTRQPRVVVPPIAEGWPDGEAAQARRIDAESRRLFASDDIVRLTLSADIKRLNKDRTGTTAYPATLTTSDGAGTGTFQVQLRPRGHFRLRKTVCSFVPLRVEFKPDEVVNTIFDGQTSLKLVTHCQNDKEFEQYALREYLVYRALNALTPRSFRVRLTRVTYVQSSDQTPVITRLGVFLEDDDDVARRMEGRVIDLLRATFSDVDQEALTLTMIFAYMIGNTDFSLSAQHNIRLVGTPLEKTYPVPYDFDLSGLVNASYAIPDRSLRLETVRDRLYRGPCQPARVVERVLQQFRARKGDVLALYDSVPELDREYHREAKTYLGEFFRLIDNPNDVRRTFVDGRCSRKPTM
jgi:hypothetical protein